MAEIHTRSLPELQCIHLDAGGTDLEQGAGAFVSLDLITGTLRAYGATDEYTKTTPLLVAACWHLRFPIAQISNDRANTLLGEITPHARRLLANTVLQDGREGIQLIRGAGQSLDAVQRICATTWDDPARISKI
ncbi:hypothetical protein ACF1HU_35920 [Streptomyces olivaceus]|uniref:hypothetical protein n=1 Tax=Streptomyces olivaceus TaxID=47716 RepID=UPI0036FC8C89